jgi:uncharacterized protein YbaP (TraB family)
MLRFLLLPALIFCTIASVSGQKNTLLYSIKGKGAHTSYLFGTIHLIADSAFYFPAKVEKTLAKTDELVLEISDISDREKALTMLHLDSGSVFDLFTPEQADSIVNWGAQSLRMSPEAFRKGFSKMKPFALLQIGAQAMMKGPVRYYELELLSRANANGQKIGGLETMEYQLSLFENLPDSVLRDMILDGLRFPDKALKANREMTALYVSQDVEGLTRLIVGSEELSGSTEALIYRRNRNWIPVMTQLMTTRSCFFAVGAGHLGGEQGVIQLLKNAGYTVTPVHY